MDIIISDRLIANTPVLWFRPADGSASLRPLIVLFHRFMASRELDANLGYMLAKAGYSVVCPQAALHGVKDDVTLRAASFWQILQHTPDELPVLIAACQQDNTGDISRLGLLGTSMGGFAVLGRWHVIRLFRPEPPTWQAVILPMPSLRFILLQAT